MAHADWQEDPWAGGNDPWRGNDWQGKGNFIGMGMNGIVSPVWSQQQGSQQWTPVHQAPVSWNDVNNFGNGDWNQGNGDWNQNQGKGDQYHNKGKGKGNGDWNKGNGDWNKGNGDWNQNTNWNATANGSWSNEVLGHRS